MLATSRQEIWLVSARSSAGSLGSYWLEGLSLSCKMGRKNELYFHTSISEAEVSGSNKVINVFTFGVISWAFARDILLVMLYVLHWK